MAIRLYIIAVFSAILKVLGGLPPVSRTTLSLKALHQPIPAAFFDHRMELVEPFCSNSLELRTKNFTQETTDARTAEPPLTLPVAPSYIISAVRAVRIKGTTKLKLRLTFDGPAPRFLSSASNSDADAPFHLSFRKPFQNTWLSNAVFAWSGEAAGSDWNIDVANAGSNVIDHVRVIFRKENPAFLRDGWGLKDSTPHEQSDDEFLASAYFSVSEETQPRTPIGPSYVISAIRGVRIRGTTKLKLRLTFDGRAPTFLSSASNSEADAPFHLSLKKPFQNTWLSNEVFVWSGEAAGSDWIIDVTNAGSNIIDHVGIIFRKEHPAFVRDGWGLKNLMPQQHNDEKFMASAYVPLSEGKL